MRPFAIALILAAGAAPAASTEDIATPSITIRTETFGRPPYSSATYHIYEQGGRTICTRFAVCNKYEQCRIGYHGGRYVDWPDTSEQPFAQNKAVTIPPSSLHKHVCLTHFGFVGKDPKR